MMERLMTRAARIGEARAATLRQRLANDAARDLPADLAVSIEGDGVVIAGRRVGVRLLTDRRLRDWAVRDWAVRNWAVRL
jgi:hypothetical protein